MKRTAVSLLSCAAAVTAVLLTGCEFAPEKPGKKYALVYGVSIYDKGQAEGYYPNLTYTDDDAIAVAKLFHKKGYTVFLRTNDGSAPPTDLSSDIDYGAATKSQLNDDFEKLDLQKNDLLLFYFSGHGVAGYTSEIESRAENSMSSAEDEYIIFGPDGTVVFRTPEDYLKDDELYSHMSKVDSTRKIVCIDACNSGGFIGSTNDIDITSPEYWDGNPTRNDGMELIFNSFFDPFDDADIPPTEAVVLTAAGEQEVSWESGSDADNGHGFLTYGMLNAPKYGDHDRDGYITTKEAYSVTKDFVEENWNSKWETWRDSISVNQWEFQFMPRISGGPGDFVLFEAD
jgi:hypothetical protein